MVEAMPRLPGGRRLCAGGSALRTIVCFGPYGPGATPGPEGAETAGSMHHLCTAGDASNPRREETPA